jgi:Flp pilus assembly protein TadD
VDSEYRASRKNSSVPFFLVAAALLGLLNLANLAATGYAAAANRQLDRPESPKALAAARIASQLAPWSAKHHALHGWLLAENRRAEDALAEYRAALRLAPADALLWAEYAQVLARLGRFDATLTDALERARALAPNSPVIERTLAEIGLSYYLRGDDAQRALWLEAMRGELARSRVLFLTHVLTRGQQAVFCGALAPKLGEEAWCKSLPAT